jgi:alkaline phosphatase
LPEKRTGLSVTIWQRSQRRDGQERKSLLAPEIDSTNMTALSKLTRRSFIKGLSAAGLGAGFFLNAQGKDAAPAVQKLGKARNLIFMVSDGMNNGTLSAANHWMNLTKNRDSAWMELYKQGVATRRLMETSSANSLVTDSAAASSAWGIGQRVNNGSINTTPDGSTPIPLALMAKAAGKKVGMVSTARITHATPAGFAANVTHRNEDSTIAVQYLEREIDVLLGGGDKHYAPTGREDGRDLYSDHASRGYEVIKSRSELKALSSASDAPLLGIFSEDHIPYAIDRANQPALSAAIPTLEEMSQTALDRLSKHRDGLCFANRGCSG